ncbi:hypothetical protein [Flavobacterium sp. XS1P27]|uniref:hypothetical protein n=1 Tax=Flavobacterium sp. XS1P27 TaxID=3401724 RepID=UPI003AACC4C7
MKNHTLILTTPKIKIPSIKILEFAKDLIAANLTNIDYFGIELDNGDDYVNDEMQSKLDNSTFITFHFEYEEINYNILNEDSIFNLIIKKINENQIGQIIIDEKDIEIYINEGQ